MGCIFSCCLVDLSEPLDCVRVIHINGHVDDYLCPVTVSHITGKPPTHVLCTSSQLLSVGARPLRPEDALESGRIYFLLPLSVFQSDSSPVDMASLVTRLTAAAKRVGPADPVKAEAGTDGSGPGRAPTQRWKPVLETIREFSFRRRESVQSIGSKQWSIGSMPEIVE